MNHSLRNLARVAALLIGCTAAHPCLAADEVHWTLTGPTSVTLDWRGTGSGVRYGLTSAYGLTATGVTPTPLPFSSAGPFWEARLTGLTTATTYHYSIDGGADQTFHTRPAPAGPVIAYAEGDVGDAVTYPRVAAVQSLIAAGAPSFVLVVGDLTYGNDDGQPAVDQHFNDVMAWSRGAAYMPAWGNHEWSSTTDDFRNYKGRFDFPNPQTSPGAPSAGCCGEDWYWFDCARTRFIAYPEPYTGAWADWDTHAAALMDQAQADTSLSFIVTFGHRPAYSSGYHPGDATLKGYLDALGAAHSKYVLNLNGHSHDYERSYRQSGVTHVTVGIGGSSLEQASGSCLWPGGCPPPAWSAYRAFHHGALRLRFGPAAIHAEAICGPAGGTTSDINDVICSVGEVIDAFTLGNDRPPALAAPASRLANVGATLTLQVTASDPDSDTILSLGADLSHLPAGNTATFTPSPKHTLGTLTWTPAAVDTGTFTIVFRAANALAATATTQLHVRPAGVGVDPDAGPPRLAIDRVLPRPGAGTMRVEFRLASGEPAGLLLVDAAGRRVLRRSLGSLAPGSHALELPLAPSLASGMYWLRLAQGGSAASAPVTVLR